MLLKSNFLTQQFCCTRAGVTESCMWEVLIEQDYTLDLIWLNIVVYVGGPNRTKIIHYI